jgi:hypothetical protein
MKSSIRIADCMAMEMFRPSLTLAIEPDGEFTLHSVTITPNSCYSAGPARPGIPPTVRLLPEVFSVLLPIKVRRGPCLMVLTPVRHRLRNLRLGDQVGKTTVTAFVMNGEQILGSASIPVLSTHECGKNPLPLDTSDWFAWVNRMPPGPVSFHVTGVAVLPSPGYEARLEMASPQGINPADLILDLVITARPGTWPQVVTPVAVRYDIPKYQGLYKTVLIRLPDGEAVQLDVEEVF